jgi:chorismate mutase/prephenate dehydratase
MNLEELRKKIDETDDRIVRLIAERIKIAEEVGEEKKKQGKQIEDLSREQIVLKNVKDIAKKEKLNPGDIESIYRQIIAVSKNMEGMVVAFQGERGAYSEEAAFQFFGSSVQVKPCESVDDVFIAVDKEETQFGIVPIENSLEGSINRTYDMFLESSLKVCGETRLRVVHCLIAGPGMSLDSVKKVYSHPQALGQCQAFLGHLSCELVPTYDTAGSVKMIKEEGLAGSAAVASARAAEIYEMQILARGIEDNSNNFTRFFILAKQDVPQTGEDKTSIVFSVKHEPGSLYRFLKILSSSGINLTKIESRPTRQKPWEYNFYLDFEGHREDGKVRQTLRDMEKAALFLKVLGSYPAAKEKL